MIPSVVLSNNVQIPRICCGTWTYDNETAKKNVLTALEVGFRAIDTAAYYQNEMGVGRAISESGIPRDHIILISKVWKTEKGYEKAKRTILESIERLNVDYIDLMLIHWPTVKRETDDWKAVNASTWSALEEFYKKGIIKSIGVSNFRPVHLEDLIENASVKPMVNQIEFHPGFMQLDNVDYCISNNIVLQARSPFGRGEAFQNEDILKIAKKHDQSAARVIVKWLWSHNVNPIIKAAKREHLLDIFEISDFELSQKEIKIIDELLFFGKLGYDPETKTFD